MPVNLRPLRERDCRGRGGLSIKDEMQGGPLLDELFGRHFERLVQSLTLAAGSQEVAMDAVQEAFVRAHLRWRRLSTYEDPVGWIRRVAVNQVIDHHRSLRRRLRVLLRLDPPAIAPAAEHVPVAPALAAALAGLSTRQRTAVALHYLEDLSVADTARTMGVTEGTVKTHLSRARRALRDQLEVDDV